MPNILPAIVPFAVIFVGTKGVGQLAQGRRARPGPGAGPSEAKCIPCEPGAVSEPNQPGSMKVRNIALGQYHFRAVPLRLRFIVRYSKSLLSTRPSCRKHISRRHAPIPRG